MATAVVNMILDRLVTKVNLDMITNVPSSNPSRAKVVKKGLLQADKLDNLIAIGITGGDHEDPNYKDGVITMDTMQDIGIDLPPREVGGGTYWWRRGVARIECFFILSLFNESKAHDVAYEALSRLMNSIDTCNPTGLVDTSGEGVVKIFCHSNTFFQSGGPPNQYIFRGKVFWSALTQRQY
jgi:hypothetical protein